MNPATLDIKEHGNALAAVAAGTHGDPFSILGPQRAGSRRFVRTIQPTAQSVELINSNGEWLATMLRANSAGVFVAELPPRVRHYRLRLMHYSGYTSVVEDCYRFPSTLGELDLHLLAEGSDRQIYNKLGSQVISVAGVAGTRFAVWAPNASRVSVVGDFNDWDGRRHLMRLHAANGIWEIFVPEVGAGASYKFELLDRNSRLLPLKSDPFARLHRPPPGNESVVYQSSYQWRDQDWLNRRRAAPPLDQPISIYEVHLGSWRRNVEDGNRWLSYRELATELVQYVKDMGFTHIELLPISEHPFDGSWGYQPIGMFAPTWRFGEPDDFRYFIDACHAAGIGVILDWVPAHFPRDEHGLGRFDGTALYEHEDPRKGAHADWGTLIFNFGRREVINYLLGSALYWLEEFHVDGIRVDAVASMLYLDYSRDAGEWIPNEQGGNENMEAVAFLQKLNIELHARGGISFAEESTAWPGVSRPVDAGGLGFTFKWNMGWMNDTLAYMSEDPIHRKFHHDKMTFGPVYAFDENFVLPLSHDEVVHGKKSLLGRMPGDEWQKFANLRAYLGFMFAHPGKKLLFMGNEIAQWQEWNHDQSLDWHLLEQTPHAGIQRLVNRLNAVYASETALHDNDFDPGGFEWLDWSDSDRSILSWLRRDRDGQCIVCISNLTPVTRTSYRIGLPEAGRYQEIFNSDEASYGGSNTGNPDVVAEPVSVHGRSFSAALHIPPLATTYLKWVTANRDRSKE